jgi:hypothetical protein
MRISTPMPSHSSYSRTDSRNLKGDEMGKYTAYLAYKDSGVE